MNTHWLNQFRSRMNEFSLGSDNSYRAVSIKIRVETGCFHREHSPRAYQIIDAYLDDLSRSTPEFNFELEEHESGPEILFWLKEGIEFFKVLFDLIVTIVKARKEGNKQGDQPTSSLEIIVRGVHKDGMYYEEKIIRIPPDHPIAAGMIKDALQKQLKIKKAGKQKKSKASSKKKS